MHVLQESYFHSLAWCRYIIFIYNFVNIYSNCFHFVIEVLNLKCSDMIRVNKQANLQLPSESNVYWLDLYVGTCIYWCLYVLTAKARSRIQSAQRSRSHNTPTANWPPPVMWPANRSLTPGAPGGPPVSEELNNLDERKIQRPKTVSLNYKSWWMHVWIVKF